MAFKYKVSDSKGKQLGFGISDDPPESPVWKLITTPKEMDEIKKHNFVLLQPTWDKTPAVEGRILEISGSIVSIKGVQVRENLRMPVEFETFIYSISDDWEGRVPITGLDVSCGGIAFTCERDFEVNDVMQVALPITSRPLLLNLRIIRVKTEKNKPVIYAAKFLNTIREEETMIRESVYILQRNYNPKI